MKKLLTALLLCCMLLGVTVASAEKRVQLGNGSWAIIPDEAQSESVPAEGSQDEDAVSERAGIGKPEIIGEHSALTGESVKLTAKLAGATKFRWYDEYGMASDKYFTETTATKGESSIWFNSDRVVTSFFAVKAYKDGKWSEFSDVFGVKREAPNGPVSLPEMDPLPFEIFAGKDLRIVAKPSKQKGVTSYIWVHDDSSGEWLWEKDIDSSGVTVIPGSVLVEGKDIWIQINYTGIGYEGETISRIYHKIRKTSSMKTDARITISDPIVRCQTGEEAELSFHAKDALAWMIYRHDAYSDQPWYAVDSYGLGYSGWWRVEFNESPELDETELSGGEEFTVSGYSYDRVTTEYYCARAYIKGQGWTGPSPIVTLQTLAPFGKLRKPSIRLIGELKAGMPATIEYVVPAGTTELYLYLENKEDSRRDFSEAIRIENPNGEKGRYTFPATCDGYYDEKLDEWVDEEINLIDGAPGTSYSLYARISGAGYDSNYQDIYFTLGQKPEIAFDLVLPNRLTQIEASAFEGDNSIYSVLCPAGLTKIGPRAFADCENLELIYVPKGAVIDETAFEGCDNLSEDGIVRY